jgi:hypothetical protein
MSRTPLHNRALPDGKDKTPLGNKAMPGKDRTPLGNKVIKDKTPLGNPISKAVGKDKTALGNMPKDVSLDQHLLDVLRSLNLAVAAVAQARDQRFADPNAKLSPQIAVQAMLHLKDAAQQLDELRRKLS